jgi:ABC-type transport system involved in multi-copper enzyme maturation permease subunit
MTSSAFDQHRARLIEYVPWLARDYLLNQGIATVIVGVLIGIMAIVPAAAATLGSVQLGAVPPELANQMLRVVATAIVFVGVLFATNGIVANDRKLGYYRFMFSKPLSPTRFYATVFGVNGVGLVIATLVLMGLWYVTVRPMSPARMVLVVAIMYVAYGSLGFLLSASWRFDWLSLVGVMLVANVGWSVKSQLPAVLQWMLYLLPPVHRATDIYSLSVAEFSTTIPWSSIAWLVGYGAVCFVAAIVVIRRRPLGTS